jgi:HD superfamily phosphohydrolase
MEKSQRIRDPIHGLITFSANDEVDRLAWKLVNTAAFQRLRRIRQLGLSELVFPGTTHSRFSHCLGTYHIAKQLLEKVKREIGQEYDEEKAKIATLGALLHDIGHGPFSHVFERISIKGQQHIKHEVRAAKIVKEDREICNVLKSKLARDLAEFLEHEEPCDIYAAIVSSQFDADRLDYLQRDRYMSGTGTGGVDYTWLCDCLRVCQVTVGGSVKSEKGDWVEAPTFVLSDKGLQAAEGYLLARYHLYQQVYYHKTTRGAECLLSAILNRLAQLAVDQVDQTGLMDCNPILLFFALKEPSVEDFLALDDGVVWTALQEMARLAKDEVLKELSARLVARKLYKCFDVGARAAVGSESLPRFLKKLKEYNNQQTTIIDRVLVDDLEFDAYDKIYYWDPDALERIMILDKDRASKPSDISSKSDIIASLTKQHIVRAYAPNDQAAKKVETLWREATQ